MRVGVLRIELQCPLVGIDGVTETPEVLEGDAEVERGGFVLGIEIERLSIMLLRRCRGAVFVQKTAKVHVGVDVVGIQLYYR